MSGDTSSGTSPDITAPFLAIPWTKSLLDQPDLFIRVPGSRQIKRLPTTEDSLLADTLKSDRAVQSCISFYRDPKSPVAKVEEMSTLLLVGNGMNGHAGIMHGGIVATVIDEAMGTLQSINHEREFLHAQSQSCSAEGKPQTWGAATFTVELKVTYLRPVFTPGVIQVKAKSVKSAVRKEWITAEVLQEVNGQVVVCSRGEALFVQPKVKPSL